MHVSSNLRPIFGALCAIATISACSPAPLSSGINDPNENRNRKTHGFNEKLSKPQVAYREANDLQVALGNVSTNLSLPGVAVNSLLQGDLRGAGISTYRFVINSTLGIAGVGDVASIFGTPAHDTDFGETLHVWGVNEGKYVVLPVFGPSTERDVAGKVVDLFTNPLSYKLEFPESQIGKTTGYLSRRGTEMRYSPELPVPDGASPDAYVRTREAFLRKRRAELAPR